MNKNYTIFLILSLLGVNIAYGMENNALNIQYLKKDIPGEYKKVIEDDQYGYIYGSSYVITHKGLLNSLEEREKNGAHVEFKSGVHSSNLSTTLKNSTFDRDEHTKNVLACEKNPLLGSPGKNIIIHGSANLTYNAYRNDESGVRIVNNKDLFMQIFNINHLKKQNEKDKKIDPSTPEKPTFISSKNTQLNETENCRTETATKIASQGNNNICEIIKSSMNYSYPASGQSLINFVKQGGKAHLIVNETAVRGAEALLTEMDEAGVNVRVSKKMEHAKNYVRYINGDYYLAFGTNNATAEGDLQKNTVFETTDSFLGETTMKERKEYIEKHTIPLAQAKEKETKKRKPDIIKTPATKKPKKK